MSSSKRKQVFHSLFASFALALILGSLSALWLSSCESKEEEPIVTRKAVEIEGTATVPPPPILTEIPPAPPSGSQVQETQSMGIAEGEEDLGFSSVDGISSQPAMGMGGLSTTIGLGGAKGSGQIGYSRKMAMQQGQKFNTENYSPIAENGFKETINDPLSTFSIDVDRASYSNIRRFIEMGSKPPKDAVRIEEMVNYFSYDYPQPKEHDPFSISTEISDCPWNKEHKLLHIGLQGKKIPTQSLPPSNLVFLLDVSGSMEDENKLPLVRSSIKMLVENLREEDLVSIVVYAGSAGVVLEPTSGSQKRKITESLDRLQAGGSTAGGEGIQLAYKLAKRNFKPNGNNRVILATDGDFNVGVSSDGDLVQMIEAKRKEGIFLTVLGFGMGNYKDSKLELLANKGNGNYGYIDRLSEAKKMLVSEFGGTLFTIAKDVKIQIEFNPAKVASYRLIGYENRLLNKEDFNDDRKDAGEIGAGHTVTALYEIVPLTGKREGTSPKVDPLKYQTNGVVKNENISVEWATVKFRYKAPNGEVSQLIARSVTGKPVEFEAASENLRFASAVVMFGMQLRDSEFLGTTSSESIVRIAKNATGVDREGYRKEFLRLVNLAHSFRVQSVSRGEE
ncbi:MAG: VWA domain-containing protein [Chloroherpetonaceae bacterium]|nr:VWA domain-containing protein [Chloroherpetonaceae bacterium]